MIFRLFNSHLTFTYLDLIPGAGGEYYLSDSVLMHTNHKSRAQFFSVVCLCVGDIQMKFVQDYSCLFTHNKTIKGKGCGSGHLNHRCKKLRKTGRWFPEIIKSGKKFWRNRYMFITLIESYLHIGKNPRK